MADQAPSRRSFLKAAVLSTAAAATVGGGAALLKDELATPAAPVIVRSNTPLPPSLPASAAAPPAGVGAVTAANPGVLVNDLAGAMAENSRLQSELYLAQQRIAALEGNLSSGSDINGQLRSQLDETTTRLGALSGLVALYSQLGDSQLVDQVGDGIQEVGARIGAIVDDIPNVSESLAAGHQALNSFESDIPLFEGGRLWLLSHVNRLWLLYLSIEYMVALAVDNAGPVVQLMRDWIERVVKWLPFGFGQRSLDVVNAVVDLLDATPETVDGAQTNVIQPLERWFGQPDGDTPLLSQLIQPLRDSALRSAENHLTLTNNLNGDFQAKVAAPLQSAVEQQQAIMQTIASYREQHGI